MYIQLFVKPFMSVCKGLVANFSGLVVLFVEGNFFTTWSYGEYWKIAYFNSNCLIPLYFFNLQSQHDELEAKFFEERAALEAKYQKLYQPLYNKVSDWSTALIAYV